MGDDFYVWEEVDGFVLEMSLKTADIQNIVFLLGKKHEIFTLAVTQDELKIFVEKLMNYTSILESFPQSFLERISRKLKI